MAGTWIVYDHHIAYETKDEILHPSADDVFSLVFGNEEDHELSNPAEQLTDYHFSRIGSSIKCVVCSSDSHNIRLELYALRKNNVCPVDMIEGQIIDQVINDNEWFYINDDLEPIQNCLRAAGIVSNGDISVNQYFELIRQKNFKNLFEDNVAFEAIKQSLMTGGSIPNGINATLYDYQRDGYLWMKAMIEISHGFILGDEMGLGKTIQVITLFQYLKSCDRVPFLVVAPVSLLENWRRECQKFAPRLDVLIHHGIKRTGRPAELTKHDIVVASYSTAVSDLSLLRMINWECVVLDEAQNIKNPYSERAKTVKAITRKSGIIVSGTPFENHVTDIWSLVDFAVPGFLGSLEDFKRNISDDVLGAKAIEPVLSPIMIRRLVKNVADDLPERVDIPQPITMSDEERLEYERYRLDACNQIKEGSPISLGLLQKLRMYCTHRFLCDEAVSDGDPATASIKYQRLCEIVEEIVANKEKVIVFTSYKKMFDILSKDIPSRFGIAINAINGDTPVEERQQIVDWFNNYGESAMLVLNPRAAGTGLNITGANHVVHYNLEWNPSLEDQATARAYRRGQSKTVFVYRLYYSDSVEQVVNERIERKREIASNAIVGNSGLSDDDDILRAIEMVPMTT